MADEPHLGALLAGMANAQTDVVTALLALLLRKGLVTPAEVKEQVLERLAAAAAVHRESAAAGDEDRANQLDLAVLQMREALARLLSG